MAQRGITTSQVEATVTGQQGFTYTLEGVARTGYYDPVTRIFVGTVENRVTTVINNVKPGYIENLKAG